MVLEGESHSREDMMWQQEQEASWSHFHLLWEAEKRPEGGLWGV